MNAKHYLSELVAICSGNLRLKVDPSTLTDKQADEVLQSGIRQAARYFGVSLPTGASVLAVLELIYAATMKPRRASGFICDADTLDDAVANLTRR